MKIESNKFDEGEINSDSHTLKNQWMKSLFQFVIAPLIIAVIGYSLGVLTESRKYNLEKDKFIYEQRARVWSSLTKCYSSYFINVNRLKIISGYESSGHRLDKQAKERLDRYVSSRDSARECLFNSLFEAKLIFSDKCKKQIDSFIDFDKNQATLSFDKQAPMSEWENSITSVLESVREEAGMK